MKIDLHLHSKASIQNGDSIEWTNNKDILRMIYRKGYKMIAFSDHNVFDYKQYLEMRSFLNGQIIIMPAIEINIITDRGAIGNVIYIFRENLEEHELRKIHKIAREQLFKSGISHKRLNEVFNEFDFISIPHVGKSDYLEISDLEKISFDAIEVVNFNHPNFKKAYKHFSEDVSIVAFSDTHTWGSFPQNSKLFTDIDLKNLNFDSLKEEFKKNKNYVQRT